VEEGLSKGEKERKNEEERNEKEEY